MKIRERLDKLKKKQKGFTLVELIVVIAIIGILAGVMLPRFFGFTTDARESAAIAEAKSIRTLAETYFASSDDGDWPTISADSGTAFRVQTSGDAGHIYDNSPTFNGRIETLAGVDMTADTTEITNGAFQYEKSGVTVTCDANGDITVNP
ncbi:prepilin cleavage protein [Desulfosporosinus sp. HMP52]|uniref:type II secretion system protein n=1 Tax=Desulfosporosinus sp. HMP52 TaxID=1487923 RepID=UPI00051FE3D1|nr:type II secretion system protein [Desulfosporosinus sp. HMP52]KGK86349.1 prepilin cleavage protein [Desulfosporosinus sp. HMP52]